MQTELWPHQTDAVEFLRPFRGSMAAMEMGTGKTLVALKMLDDLDCQSTLVVCPKSVVPVWPREVRKHGLDDLRVVPLEDGTTRDRMARLATQADLAKALGQRLVVVLNYDVLTRSVVQRHLFEREWGVVIYDESHRIKSARGKQSKFCQQMRHRAQYVWGLTGTPMPHSPLDIFGQFRAIDPTVFGYSWTTFRNSYAVTKRIKPRGRNHEVEIVVGFRNLDDLHDRMYTRTYRCLAEDVLTLPEAQSVTRYCRLGPNGSRVYTELEQTLRTQIRSGEVRVSDGMVKLLRLQQVTSGVLPDAERSGGLEVVDTTKRDILLETLDDLTGQAACRRRQWLAEPDFVPDPVVVFCRFHHDLNVVHEVCTQLDLTSCELSGRRHEVDRFEDGYADVIAVQLQAGGLGIDLTRACYAIYLGMNWSLGDHEQTMKRLHRPGQHRPVTFVYLIAEGTVDELVVAALQSKREVIGYVVDQLGAGPGEGNGR